MKNLIFVPQTIRVGYRKRDDTYTGKLAYVIYLDAKGKVRKEASWQSWRDNKIESEDFRNDPTSGFVLNKKVGDYKSSWNHRQAYSRVYDPRGFEFEITIENLLYILENANSIKGKGLEGQFVYGWSGSDLILLPVDSPDYKEITDYTNSLVNPEKITGKDLILGAVYQNNKNEELIYLGRFDKFEPTIYYRDSDGIQPCRGKHYFFYDGNNFVTLASLTNCIVKTISTEPVSNYASLMSKLEHNSLFSPINPEHSEWIDVVSIGEMKKYKSQQLYILNNGIKTNVQIHDHYGHSLYYDRHDKELAEKLDKIRYQKISYDYLFENFKFLIKKIYLMNKKEWIHE